MAMDSKKTGYDPMKEMITDVIPYAPAGEQQNMYVGLNGKTYNIPRGKSVELPMPVWEIIKRALAAERKVEEELRKNAPK